MFAEYVEAGGPIMYACLLAWVIVFAGVLDRFLYAFGRVARRPRKDVEEALARGRSALARTSLERERLRSERGLERIDAVSQIATSIGLFGTVVGIARSFFVRGSGSLAGPDALASGLSTALFTTIAGLVVFLFGQGFLIAYSEWRSFCERGLDERLAQLEADEGLTAAPVTAAGARPRRAGA